MKPPVLLHVEDDPNDALFVKLALKRSKVDCQIHLVVDGQEALDYLTGSGPFADRYAYPVPQIVLLDLKLPAVDGFRVLAWARSQPAYQNLPIVILSGSDLEEDFVKARFLGATNYIVKDFSYDTLVHCVTKLLSTGSSAPDAAAANSPD